MKEIDAKLVIGDKEFSIIILNANIPCATNIIDFSALMENKTEFTNTLIKLCDKK